MGGTSVRRYVEPDADSARWEGFAFRPGDIVIAAPSKSGTTWTQLLVALLVFDGPDFPAPINVLSPWLDQKTRTKEEVHELLAAQDHRRFIKTHTPLDGVPLHDEVSYVCVGRDPRDAAVSMFHHADNMDHVRRSELIGSDVTGPLGTHADRLDDWIDGGPFPDWSARFLFDHYATFWERRHDSNVELFHFTDYVMDLPGELHRLAGFLDIDLDSEGAATLAEHAHIDRARARADDIVPEAHLGMFKNTSRFLRSGGLGDGAGAMSAEQAVRYEAVVGEIGDEDLNRWIHHGRRG